MPGSSTDSSTKSAGYWIPACAGMFEQHLADLQVPDIIGAPNFWAMSDRLYSYPTDFIPCDHLKR